jgi:hypothetical protein
MIRFQITDYKYITPRNLGFQTRYGQIIVPQAFCFDGDSGVPDLNINAACLHDYLYFTGVLTKHQADVLLRDLMVAYGLRVSGWLYYLGVALFGYKAWRNHRKAGNSLATIDRVILPNASEYILPDATWLIKDLRKVGI